MRPSFSPRRVTVDEDTGRLRVDGQVLLKSPSVALRHPNSLLAEMSTASRSPPPTSEFTRANNGSMHQDSGKGVVASSSNKRLVLEGVVQAVITGVIIAIVLTPVMIGFATMIYGHPEFESVMPMLTKLVFVSSVAHQLVITLLSPLPFAIGQTQDAGLIFLSSMAVSIMTELGPTIPLKARVATVVVHLSISASLVGLGLILIGKLRLASLVQYLPTPVIGGYLAYIGFFMVKGGITLMTGSALSGIISWSQLLTAQQIALLAPGLICGLLLSVTSARYKHFAVFPCCLVVMPAAFFFVLAVTGNSIEDARSYGFLSPETQTISLTEVYDLFDFSSIHWEVMFPQQLPTMLSMFLVIAFASSLDIASICMGTGCTMNFDEQLQTVGTANFVSGLFGGYSGSYIFSQTVFSFRFHPTTAEEQYPGFSRLVGLSLAACELAIALTPFSLTTIIPKFLFGSVMIFIGVELLKTWLVGVYTKLLLPEYATVVSTFLFLNAFGVQIGLGAGVGLAALCFLVEYSRAQVVQIVHKSSNVIRNAEEHELLYGHTSGHHGDALMKEHPIVTVELRGHIFFGSATRILSDVKRAVFVRPLSESSRNKKSVLPLADEERLPLLSPAITSASRVQPSRLINLNGEECLDRHRGRTRFVVFDFSQVSGMDATAARSCFLALTVLFRRNNITVVYCGMHRNVKFLLVANDVIVMNGDTTEQSNCHVATDLDIALDWCEQQLIASVAKKKPFESGRDMQAILPATSQELSISKIFLAYLPQEQRKLSSTCSVIERVSNQFSIQRWKRDERIFTVGDPSESWLVLLRGQVTLYNLRESPDIFRNTNSNPSHANKRIESFHGRCDRVADRELVGRVRPGCIFGDMDFILCQNRTIDAICTAEETVTATISRSTLEQLAKTEPVLAYMLQEVVMRASYMTLAEKLHSIVV